MAAIHVSTNRDTEIQRSLKSLESPYQNKMNTLIHKLNLKNNNKTLTQKQKEETSNHPTPSSIPRKLRCYGDLQRLPRPFWTTDIQPNNVTMQH